MSCCSNIMDLGCFNHCDIIEISELVADVTGVYTFEVTFAGHTFSLPTTFTMGDNLTLDLSYFNEHASLIVKIKDTTGEYLEYAESEFIVYDCFRINTKVIASL